MMMRESLIDELKRYIGFTADDAARLRAFAPLVEPHLVELSERFYAQIPAHPEAAAVFTGGAAQIARLELSLQRWARGLFSGVYDAAYTAERFRIGVRHVQIGLPQRYVIGAIHVVEDFLRAIVDAEASEPERSTMKVSLSRIINIDLNLICETYFAGSLRQLRGLNDELATANRSLGEANRVKDQFLATTSHELRTPLTSIIGFATLLVDGYIPDEAGRREAIADIHRSARTLLALVEDLLDISRIEAGRLEMRIQPVSVADIFADVEATLAVQAREKSVALDCEAAVNLPPVAADRTRVRQIVLNLTGNALKFTDQGSVRVTAEYESESHRVRITVADTGIGIPVDQQSRLFETFHQLDQGRVRQRGGAGLGLSISKALVEQMGGTIRVESAGVGQGTTASAWLRVADRPAAVAPAPEHRRRQPTLPVLARDAAARSHVGAAFGPAPGHLVREGATEGAVECARDSAMKRVVIVEDNELIVKFYRYVLERDGYVVSATESGDETRQWARAAETVAIILDISLRATSVEGRSVDGLELGRMLKADPATRMVPIIIATAHAMAGDRERFLRESGAEAFLRKPVTDPTELTSLIQQLSERRRSPPAGPS